MIRSNGQSSRKKHSCTIRSEIFGDRINGRIFGHTVLKHTKFGQKWPISAKNTEYTTEYTPYAEWPNPFGATMEKRLEKHGISGHAPASFGRVPGLYGAFHGACQNLHGNQRSKQKLGSMQCKCQNQPLHHEAPSFWHRSKWHTASILGSLDIDVRYPLYYCHACVKACHFCCPETVCQEDCCITSLVPHAR